MSVITRFAPSPTGFLHVGNVRTALVCYLFAKANNGKFMLRLDDTDMERSNENFVNHIFEDLKWLGLEYDLTARQSLRLERYNEIKQQLIELGRIYPCFESSEELEVKRKMLLKRGKPPIYDRAALKLSKDEVDSLIKAGKMPHWRFKLDHDKLIKWDDLIKGPQQFDPKNLSDPIIIRANGAPTYMLPSAIDDMDFKITHVVRGEDHVSNTAIQIQLFEAMSSHIPQFAHQSLMKSKEGKISKRTGGFDILSLREAGIEPLAIESFLARLGTSEPIEPRVSLEELVQHFDITKFSKAAAIYDFTELERMNAKVLHLLGYNRIKHRLKAIGLEKLDEEFWQSVHHNLNRFDEIKDWWHIIMEDITPVKNDQQFLNTAAELLPNEPWDETTFSTWANLVKEKTGHKGKELFMPLRLAITGKDNGPELKQLLPLIGREKVLKRIVNYEL